MADNDGQDSGTKPPPQWLVVLVAIIILGAVAASLWGIFSWLFQPSTPEEIAAEKLAQVMKIAEDRCLARYGAAASFDYAFDDWLAYEEGADPHRIIVQVKGTMQNAFGANQKVIGECIADRETGQIKTFNLY